MVGSCLSIDNLICSNLLVLVHKLKYLLITSSVKFGGFFVVVVCLFRGNNVGERPYESGTPCSNCPSNKPYCDVDLCAEQAPSTEAPSPTTTEATTEAPSPTTPEATTEAPTFITKTPTMPAPTDCEFLSYHCT